MTFSSKLPRIRNFGSNSEVFDSVATLQIPVAIIGLDQAGKTTLINYMRTMQCLPSIPTYGYNVTPIRYSKLRAKVFDLGGQRAFRIFWKGFIEQSRAVIFVIDASNPSRIAEAAKELSFIQQQLESGPHKIPLLLLANKHDKHKKSGYLTKSELRTYLKIEDYKGGPWRIQETSAKSGYGISEAFRWLNEILTGERLPAPLSIREVVIFNSAGINIATTRGGEVTNPTLISGFLTAIDIFAKETLERNLDTLVLGDRKLTWYRLADIIGVIIMNVENSESVAHEVLSEILSRIQVLPEAEREEQAQQILDIFMRDELPRYLSSKLNSITS
ncbi:MAG: ADP-ribosylation factor family protein [Candidatus Hodarchaeota archaeon]